MATGRPTKGLTEKLLVRLSENERWMLQTVQQGLGEGVSLNDAVRICIRRGYALIGPSPDTDGPVLDPDWRPAPLHRPVPHITGQQAIDDPEDTDS